MVIINAVKNTVKGDTLSTLLLLWLEILLLFPLLMSKEQVILLPICQLDGNTQK